MPNKYTLQRARYYHKGTSLSPLLPYLFMPLMMSQSRKYILDIFQSIFIVMSKRLLFFLTIFILSTMLKTTLKDIPLNLQSFDFWKNRTIFCVNSFLTYTRQIWSQCVCLWYPSDPKTMRIAGDLYSYVINDIELVVCTERSFIRSVWMCCMFFFCPNGFYILMFLTKHDFCKFVKILISKHPVCYKARRYGLFHLCRLLYEVLNYLNYLHLSVSQTYLQVFGRNIKQSSLAPVRYFP